MEGHTMIRKTLTTLAFAGLFVGSPLAAMAGTADLDSHPSLAQAAGTPEQQKDVKSSSNSDDSSAASTSGQSNGQTSGTGNKGSADDDDSSNSEGTTRNPSASDLNDGSGGG
jgi:hypothetical protein